MMQLGGRWRKREEPAEGENTTFERAGKAAG
jgi:hypothetical protein